MKYSILHLSYSSEPVMRRDYQILLKSPPITCHKFSKWCYVWWSLTINSFQLLTSRAVYVQLRDAAWRWFEQRAHRHNEK